MKSLYGEIEEMKKIELMLEESGGEITEEIGALMDAHSAHFQAKIDSVVGYKNYLEDSLELVTKKRKELQSLEKTIKGRSERFKDYVIMCMRKANLKKIESLFSRITLPKQRSVVVITDKEKIPGIFIKTEIKKSIDKVAIKHMLEQGNEVVGARLELGKESVLINSK